MQDGGAIPNQYYSFEIDKGSVSLDILKRLLTQLSRGSTSNPKPDGAKFTTTPFSNPPQNVEFEVKFNQSDVEGAKLEIVNEKELSIILRNVRLFLQENDRYYEIARNTTITLDGKPINGGTFLARGVSGALETDTSYESKEKGLEQTISLLLQLLDKLIIGESPEESQDKDFIYAQIPEELKRYIGVFNLETWKFIHLTIITPLHRQVSLYENLEKTKLEHAFPDYRRFLNKWLDEAFKSTDPKVEPYLKKLKKEIKEKLLLKLKFPDSGLLASPLVKSEADDKALQILYKDFHKTVLAIFENKPWTVAFKEVLDKEDLVDDSGGAETDLDEQQDDEEVEELEDTDTLTVDEAEKIVKNNIYPLLLEPLDIENQKETKNFSANLTTNREKVVFEQQLRLEIFITFIDPLNLKPQLTDTRNSFYDERVNLIDKELFYEQLEFFTQAAFLSINQTKLTPETGYDLLLAAYHFAKETSIETAGQDLTPVAASDKQQATILAAISTEFLTENNITSYQDLKNISSEKLLGEILEKNPREYLSERRRLENVFLSYVQNQGLNVSSLEELDYGLQLAITNEISSYFNTLSSEDLARLIYDRDYAFRLKIASQLNRELLLGKFQNSQFYARLHIYVQQELKKSQSNVEGDINDVLKKYDEADAIDLAFHDADDIERMSIKEFKEAFPNSGLPDDISKITPEFFEEIKRRQINEWQIPQGQKGIIQRLMLAYGDDTSFIDGLNSVDRINFVLGLNLPKSLSDSDLRLIQQKLKVYWQLQIDKVVNERNFANNNNYAKKQGYDSQDSNSSDVRAYSQRLNRSVTPVLSQEVRSQTTYAGQTELIENMRGIENYGYAAYLAEQEANALETNIWAQRALLARNLLEAEALAAEVDRQASLAAYLGAATTQGYRQQQKTGLRARLGLGKTGKKSANKAADKAKKEAVQQAAGLVNPALGALNKAMDVIEDVTGVSKEKQIGALIAAAAGLLIKLLSNLAGVIGSLIFGAIGFATFGIPGAIVLGSIGYGVGTWAGNAWAGSGGFSLPGLGTASAAAPSITTTSTVSGVPAVSTAGFAIGTFTVVTVATSVISIMSVNSAFLLPTIGADNTVSEYVIIEKRAVEGIEFDNGSLPNPVTYQISIRPRTDNTNITVSRIAIRNMTDTMTIRAKDESLEFADQTKGMSDLTDPEDLQNGQIILGPDDVYEIEYTQNFEGTVQDASITNNFEIAFDVSYTDISGSTQQESTTAFTAETICVGDCPAAAGVGCWPASGITTQIPFDTTFNVTHKDADAFDIGAEVGNNVYAPFDGNLTQYSTEEEGHPFGNSVKLVTTDGAHVLVFAHLVSFGSVTSGQVTAGEIIGHVGSTGNSTGPHLHYERANANGEFYSDPAHVSTLRSLVPDPDIGLRAPVRSCYDN